MSLEMLRNAREKGEGTELRKQIGGTSHSKYLDIPYREENHALIRSELDAWIAEKKFHYVTGRAKSLPLTGYIASEKDAIIKAMRRAFVSAKKRGNYHLTEIDKQRLIQDSDFKCQLTGTPFSLEKFGSHKAPFSPSLDRADSSIGYTPENCRFICTATNFALNEWGDGVFDIIARGYTAKYLCDGLPKR